jgi:hypothetical protein
VASRRAQVDRTEVSYESRAAVAGGGWHSRSTPSSGNARAFRHLRYVATSRLMQRSNRISTRHFVGDLQVIGDTEEESQAGIDRLISSDGALPTDQILRFDNRPDG